MAGYTRTFSKTTGDTINASDFNSEYQALDDAFDASTGHAHDGTTGEGAYVPLISDSNNYNVVEVDSGNNEIEFSINVSSAKVEQLKITDGAILPTTTNDIDLGGSSNKYKNLYVAGTTSLASTVIEQSTSDTALRITQTGTGYALLVEDEANPDSTPFVINSEGRLTIGGFPDPNFIRAITITGTTTSDTGADFFNGNNDNAVGASALRFTRSRSNTNVLGAIVQDGDRLGRIVFAADTGDDSIENCAILQSEVEGTPTITSIPANFRFLTITEGDNTASEKMRISSDGNVGIGTDSPARVLHVNNVMRLEPTATAPSSPSAGDLYFDSSDSKLKCYDGSTWQNCF